MCESNFRIKLDLCKFYDDVHRFCWIFIDSTKMLKIIHIIKHIVKLFKIKEPFHLLLNEVEYLPPHEDIRILKENETVLVSPGPGLKRQFALAKTVSTTALPEKQSGKKSRNTSVKLEQTRNSYQYDKLQTSLSSTLSSTDPHEISCSVEQIISNPVEQTIPDSVERITSSSIEQAMSTPLAQAISSPIQQRVSSPVEQKMPTSFQQTESMSVHLSSNSSTKSQENVTVHAKRKRYRRAKKKIQTEYPTIKKNENSLKKPMIKNCCIVPRGKHIRFDNIDDKIVAEKDTTSVETMNDANMPNVSPLHDLANLLSLGKSSAPLTFMNIRAKDEIKVEPTSVVEISPNLSSENIKKDITVTNEIDIEEDSCNTDFGAFPVMVTKPQPKDVIAFQILKMGMDYTPQVSNFIIAEVISYCPETSLYTLKVTQGLSEMQEPNGKFALTTEEEECVTNDTVTLSYDEIIKPRLVSTRVSNGAINPVNSIDY